MTDVCCDLDIPLDSVSHDNQFVDNVLIYISGFIMRKLIEKEKCSYCYTYLTECKERVSCQLINFKQLGGLVYPIFDVVSIVEIANRNMKLITFYISFLFTAETDSAVGCTPGSILKI